MNNYVLAALVALVPFSLALLFLYRKASAGSNSILRWINAWRCRSTSTSPWSACSGKMTSASWRRNPVIRRNWAAASAPSADVFFVDICAI